ncbi:MAG: YrrS family protein [Halobacillus sp.]|uniref:YrrS family protein n=1 Tax=Halobacillus sp. TaxID=56800 RepID=UPI003BAE65CD
MADKHTEGSRAHRFEKKRKSTILMNWLVGAGSALLIVFIAMMAFGGDDQPSNAKGSDEEKAVLNSESDQEENSEEDKNNNGSTNDQTNKQDSEQDESNGSDPNSSSNSDDEDNPSNEESSEDESSDEEQDKDASEEENDVVIEESDKENVAKIVKKDWQPVPTEMNTSGNHTISYNENSQDWNELIKAVSKATGLSKENMITWWIGNGGSPQKAEATVSNKEKTEHYRVFIQWVDGEGYKPVKLEVLEEKEVNR